MVTMKDMEARMENMQSGFRRELDDLHSTVRQLYPKEITEGISKLSHLEQSISAFNKGIQEIKRLLTGGGKNLMSSSPPKFEPGHHESGSPKPFGERGKSPHPATQSTTIGIEYLPQRLQLPVFDGADPTGWVFQVKQYFEINDLHAEERLRVAMVCMESEALAWYIWIETSLSQMGRV